MDVAVTDLNGCKKSLSIVIPSDVVEDAFNRRTRELAKAVRLPGFRPGKAPASLIRQRFHKKIKAEVVHELVESRLEDVIKEKGLHPISQPVVDKLEFEVGSPLTLQVSFEVWPEIQITNYVGLPIQVKNPPEITDEEVGKVLEQYREEAASYVPVENRPIQEGDLVQAEVGTTYEARGKPVHLPDEEVSLTVGDSRVPSAFSENLIGLKPGDEKDFTIEYNNVHPDKRLAGRAVRHKVKVREVKTKHLPELNDDLAKDVGEYETLDQLRDYVKQELQAKARRTVEEEAKQKLLDQILEQNPFDVPETLVENRLQRILYEIAHLLGREGIDVKEAKIDWKKMAEDQMPRARREVRQSLVLDQIAKNEHLEVLPAEVDMELARIAKGSGTTVEVARATYQQQDRLADLKTELRFKKALDFIYHHAKIINGEGGEL